MYCNNNVYAIKLTDIIIIIFIIIIFFFIVSEINSSPVVMYEYETMRKMLARNTNTGNFEQIKKRIRADVVRATGAGRFFANKGVLLNRPAFSDDACSTTPYYRFRKYTT